MQASLVDISIYSVAIKLLRAEVFQVGMVKDISLVNQYLMT